ncbi:MAG: LytR C-terminal domain-containing protein [Candidatus Kapabacteria bacterium]|nr:LytR C-terminal domain-containing protein [Candidatus Kapabacteria bacterium]
MNVSPTVKVSLTVALFLLLVVLSAFFVKRMFFTPPIEATIHNESSNVTQVIQVNVVNASGEQGVAKKAMDYLRHRGFDVIEISNSSEQQTTSEVLDRVGDSIMVHQVAYAMGISSSHISTELDTNMYLHATILIGTDYPALKPFK